MIFKFLFLVATIILFATGFLLVKTMGSDMDYPSTVRFCMNFAGYDMMATAAIVFFASLRLITQAVRISARKEE